MTIRLSGHDRKQLAMSIKADLDQACKELYAENYRSHLGISIIGEKCLRKLVYSFRWMHREQFDGRMLRLFSRGHLTESRFAEWLKASNIFTWGVSDEGEQIKVSFLEQHYGGSMDGVARLPEKYNLSIPFLLEMKTHNDKSFKKLVKAGTVRTAKPMHYIQMCGYGEAQGIEYGIYLAINKNDDDIYVEVVEIDVGIGRIHLVKAKEAITTRHLPPKIAASPSYFDCEYCSMCGICHLKHKVDINCRSCANSVPAENGEWYCEKWKAIIPKDAILKACPEWKEFS